MTKLLLSALSACLLLAASPTQAQPVDNTLFAQVLAKHVHNGLVDYSGLKADPSKLDAYLAQLAAADLPSLPERERFAAYINLYNAATIKLILDHFPVASIRDIGGLFGSPWKLPVVRTRAGTIILDPQWASRDGAGVLGECERIKGKRERSRFPSDC